MNAVTIMMTVVAIVLATIVLAMITVAFIAYTLESFFRKRDKWDEKK